MSVFVLLALQGIVIIGGAIGLGWWLRRRLGTRWSTWGWGALAFVGAQIVHIPVLLLLTFLFQRGGVQLSTTAGVWINMLLLGGTAGLFENVARYIVLRWGARSARTWNDAVMFGAGHGGIEAMLLIGFSVGNALVLLSLGDTLLQQTRTVAPEQATALAQQLASLRSMPWWMLLISIWERALAITLHIALSIIVLRTVVEQRLRWLSLAIGLHALFDGALVALQHYINNNLLLIEGTLTVLAIVPILIIVQTQRAARKLPTPTDLATPQHI